MATYSAGQGVRVSAAFTDSTGAAVDPGTVTLKFEGAGAAPQTWVYGGNGSIVKDSVGNYHAILDTTNAPGNWPYEWVGTGNNVLVAASSSFTVLALPI